KANIMISINGIILTVVIASVAPRIVSDVWLLIPATMLLLTGLCSMIFAVLCARPRVLSRIVTLDDVRGNRANILFFGNFTNMTEADYVEGMTELMLEPERIYHNMSRDIYGLGRVLKLKFKLLRVSYTIFMWGLTLSVATFLILAVVQYQLNT
ncbi:MAG: Pycsar system effector family protein, partial [Bacteroidota bacterium]